MSSEDKKLLDLSAQLEELLAQRDARISTLERERDRYADNWREENLGCNRYADEWRAARERADVAERQLGELSAEVQQSLDTVQRLTHERDHLRRALDWVAEASGLKAGADPQAVVSHVEQLARGGREQA